MSGSGRSSAIASGLALSLAGIMVLGALGGDARAERPFDPRNDVDRNVAAGEDPELESHAQITPDRHGQDAEALAAAVKPSAGAPVAAWAESASAWARPGLQSARRVAAAYEPHLDFQVRPNGSGSEARVQVSLGPTEDSGPVKSVVNKLGFIPQATPAIRKKSRLFLFAAVGSDAVGYNVLRNRDGQIRRAGFSAEKLAASGESQVGFGWRRGPLQASLGFLQREISAYGARARERFLGLTFSFRPEGARLGGSAEEDRQRKMQGYPYQARSR